MSEQEKEEYGDPGIASFDAPFPRWLKIIYFVLPIWGVACFYLYWNGSYGWLDRGYWKELEIAANTTYPHINWSEPSLPETKQETKQLEQYP